MKRRRTNTVLWVMALLLGALLATGAAAADPGWSPGMSMQAAGRR